MAKSTVYLTGAGPGDVKLLTLRALELIKKADCIVYDYLVNPQILKYAKEDCELVYAGKSAGRHALPQEGINRLLVKKARRHRTVVRLKGGDPFIFGRGAEEALYLKKCGINFEIAPGITSAIAAAAYAGIPLTLRSKNSNVGFVAGHEDPAKEKSSIDWASLSKAFGTLVFLMGAGNLPFIAKKLIECGRPPGTPAAVIRWGTTSRQKSVCGTLGNIAELARKNKMTPPAIIVAGEVAGLSEKLKWFEKRPLLGKRIIVTRTRKQAGALSESLADFGAEAIEIPTIRIKSLKADEQVKEAFADKYDWAFFTSPNGVGEFCDVLDRLGADTRILSGVKICAMGQETAKALKAAGIRADFVPSEFVAEAILRHFKEKNCRKRKRAVILRAKKARNTLPDGLKRLGFAVRTIDLYDTLPEAKSKDALRAVLKEGVDIVAFTSSSTVENFIGLLGAEDRRSLKGVRFASIGPVTSRTLKKYGLRPHIQAKTYTIEGLADAVIKEYREQRTER